MMDESSTVTPLAGGTNLLVDLRGRLSRPQTLMNIAGLDELRGVHVEDGYVVVGSAVTIADLKHNVLIAKHGQALRQAATVFANPLIRNRATIGGNLAYGSPAADAAPPLLVLGAKVELLSKDTKRTVPLKEFITGVRKTVRHPKELITAIRWPIPPEGSVGVFRKLGLRKADAISVLSIAVMLHRKDTGDCDQVRIALGAVAPTPIRVAAAEDFLDGGPLTPEVIAQAAQLASEATQAIGDIRGSAAYRKRVITALVRRLLTNLAKGTKEKKH
ncbi:MAG: xanthine dehydrogenase family protein subunit M [Candidatus Bipolaricaulota bacterium]